jgi:hypothetical protein
LTIIGWTGFVASSLQCSNALFRTNQAVRDPTSYSLDELDRDPDSSYHKLETILDVTALAAGGVGVVKAGREVFLILSEKGGMVTAEKLAGMTALQRRAATARAVEKAAENAADKALLRQAMLKAGMRPNQIEQVMSYGIKSLRQSTKVAGAISKVSATKLSDAIRTILMDGIIAPTVSGAPEEYVGGAASGVIHEVVVHVMSGK